MFYEGLLFYPYTSKQNLLLVKTKIAPSHIHGIGLFADQFVPKGTLIWKFTPGFDLTFTREQILNFPVLLQIYISKYSWRSKTSRLYCFSSDNGKYFNHSNNPNCLSEYRNSKDEVVTIAIRDIQKDEEITDNYSSFENDKSDGNVLDDIVRRFHLQDELDPRYKN